MPKKSNAPQDELSVIEKKRKKKNRKDDASDSASESSDAEDSVSTVSMDEGVPQTVSDELIEAIGQLSDKRAFVREENLNKVLKIMRQYYTTDILQNYVQTLLSALLSCIIKGGYKEVTTATLCLGTFAITCLDSSLVLIADQQYVQICQTLESRLIQNKFLSEVLEDDEMSDLQECRSTLMFTLGLVHFIRDTNQDILRDNDGILAIFCKNHWNEIQPLVLEQAIRAFTLMSSFLPHKKDILWVRYKAQLVSFLQQDNVFVQLAAGEAIALLCGHVDDEDEEEQEVIHRVEDLSNVNTKSVGKKDQNRLKQGFREYLNTLEKGDEPQEKVTIRKIGVHIEGWPATIVLNALRFFLGSGWMKHIQINPLVRTLLDVEDIVFDEKQVQKLTSGEKKAMYSKNSMKSKLDTIERSKRTKQFSNFLTQE